MKRSVDVLIAVITIAFIFAGFFGSEAGAGSPGFTMEENMNRYGEDYKDIGLATADPVLCAQACMKEGKCKAWTYVKPGVQAESAWCWLKDKVPPPSPDENCISGVKTKRK